MTELTRVSGALDTVEAIAAKRQTIYVYEAPVRLWHWINALAIAALIATGYLIASPPPTQPGDASSTYLFGYIRYAHFVAGQIMAVAFLYRVYWAFVGNAYARQLFALPVHDRIWRWGMLYELRWYLFLVRHPKKYVGHNPLANTMMFVFVLNLLFMMITGFALYAEAKGTDHWMYMLFGWVFAIWPNSQDVHTWHHLGMWGIVMFVIMHVYAAIREEIVSRQSMLSTMMSGERTFRDERPD